MTMMSTQLYEPVLIKSKLDKDKNTKKITRNNQIWIKNYSQFPNKRP